MSAILGNSVTGAGGGAYTVDNSLRTRASASAYLSRTPGVAGNRKTWTWSGWVKRGLLSSSQVLFGCRIDTSNDLQVFFDSSDKLTLSSNVSGSEDARKTPTMVFRDPSAWYHIVIVFDAVNTVINFYINGVQVTAWDENNQPSNVNAAINSTSLHRIAISVTGNQYFDGYLSNINFIDGQALTPSSFGETNASTGVWQPKAYTGTYGTNGFYLKFSDIATTSGANSGLGKDFSGNSNYWNTNNISVTAGVTYDAMKDSPTPASSTVGNFAVMNPLDQAGGLLVTDGNLKTTANSGWDGARATFSLPASGKYYWEATCISRSTGATVGLLSTSAVITGDVGAAATGYIYNSGDGQKYNNGTNTAYGATWGTNDIIGVAWDAGTATLVFYKNGVSQGTAWSGLSGTYSPAIGVNGSDSMAVNFGQRPFSYTPPTGYVALQSYNLPTPTVGASSTTLANKYFDTVLYTGNGGTQAVTGLNFQPDFVWTKGRSSVGQNHLLSDAVRGVGKSLISNTDQVEGTRGVTAFNSNGFTYVYPSEGGDGNYNGEPYVGWNWNAGGSTVTNTSGSISSQVRANTTSGFSVVTYTGTGANATVGHGLGVAPKMVIAKRRNSTGSWGVYHIGLTSAAYQVWLNLTSEQISRPAQWNSTAPTSSVFSIGTDSDVNASGSTYVAYCFAEKTGFSKFGSYTGNSSTDGTFVYTGFRPAYVMIKRINAAGQWSIRDDMRLGYNANNYALEANQNTAETSSTAYACDLLSNGFKLRTSDDAVNQSGDTYIYMAFAENPFNYSLAR